MTTVNPFAAPQMPLSQVLDGGGGGANAGGSQAGSGSSQGGSPAGGGSAISPVSLADDTPISHEGKTTTWKQYRESQFAPKSELENVRTQTRAEVTNNLRKLAAQIQQQQKQHQQQHPQQRVDPFASVRDLPIVDGKTLASLAENGFGQLAQAIQQLQKQNQTLGTELKQLKGGFGTIAKERNSQERTSRVSQAISSLGEGFDPKDDFLKDLALDLMDAWEFEKPEEFPAMLKDRVERSLKFAKAYQKAQLDASKKRIFTRPGGNASPNGPARSNPRLAPMQLADALFASSNT